MFSLLASASPKKKLKIGAMVLPIFLDRKRSNTSQDFFFFQKKIVTIADVRNRMGYIREMRQ